MLASILTFTLAAGYPLLFALIAAESAGVPLPGETALLTAASLAGQGKLSIALVIAVAATAAIIGDNIGYLVARKGGRRLLQRPGPFARQRRRVLEVGEPFFERHGPKAVFFGRWVLGLRTWASWLAGASHMPWRTFSLWNATGGISWALTIGLVGYFVGQSTASLFSAFGLIGLATVLIAAVGIFFDHWRRAKPRSSRRPPAPAIKPPPAALGPQARPRRESGR